VFVAKIKDLEDMATSINMSCKTLDHALKEKLGIAYEVVVQWRINKVLKRIKANESGAAEVSHGSKRSDGRNPSRTRKRPSVSTPELPLHMARPEASSGAPVEA
jgi:AraC-like DNA-binding protein